MINRDVLITKQIWKNTAPILFFLAGPAFAAPVIEQVNGTVAHASTVTITGSSFGSKTNAAPLRWDDFEAGAVGQNLTGWSISSTKIEYRPKYVSVGRENTPGKQSAHQHFERNQYNAEIGIANYASKKFYVSGWVKGKTEGTASRNVKLVSFRGKDFSDPEGRFDQYPDQAGNGHKYVVDCNGTVKAQDWAVKQLIIADGEWHRFEAWINLGTPNGNNGVYTTWKDTLEWGNTLKGTFITSDCSLYNAYIQHYFATDTATDTKADYYWDELYVDTSLARVELGNADTWQKSTHREIQIASAWSPSSISFKVNRGSFPLGQDVYLFVVDENGVPSAGRLVTIGASSSNNVTISAPTNLRITQ